MSLLFFRILTIPFLLALFVPPSPAQDILRSQLSQGFGKNKVQYQKFEWWRLKTKHLEVYYQLDYEWLAEKAATILEEGYTRISADLHHDLSTVPPIIVFQSHYDFEQTNIVSDILPPGVGGFAEALKYRAVIPFNGNLEEFRNVLVHELTHIFQYDILYKGPLKALTSRINPPPSWIMEGLAEYEAGEMSTVDEMVLRDAVLSDNLIPLSNLEDFGSVSNVFLAYKQGHSLMQFIGAQYGREPIRRMLREWKSTPSTARLLQKLLGVDMATLDRSWTSHLKQKYWPLLKDRRFPYDIASPIPPDGGKMSYLSPTWSLGGEMIAAVATDGIDLDISLVKAQDGRTVKKLTERMRGGVYTELKGREGTVAWAPDGERIAFVARKGPVDQLYIWDVYRASLVDTLIFTGIQEINTIAWAPDGRRLAFSGSQYGQTDIYVVDLTTKRLSQITNTPDMEDQPAWAPDNRRLAFSAKRENSFDILIATPDSSTATTPLITGPTDDTWPRWLPDGDHLLFASTRDGINDLFAYDLQSGAERQLTKTTSGLSEPAVSPDGGKVAFISYARGRRGLYVMDLPSTGQLRPVVASSPADSILPTSDHHIPTDPTTPSPPSVLLASTSFADAPDTAAVPSCAPYYRSPYRTKLDLDAFSTQVVLSNRFLNTVLQLSLSDLFGNHQLVFAVDYTSRISSINDFNFAALYSFTGRRMPVGAGVFNWTQFFGRQRFTPTVLGTLVEDEIWADRQMGLLINTSYPFDLYRRIDLSYTLVNENFELVSNNRFSNDLLVDGTSTSSDTTTHLFRGAYVHDTIVYGPLGPTRGARYYLSAGRAVKLTSSDREFTHLEVDYRKYLRAGGWSVFAFRLKGIAALGANGFTYYLGGPSLVTALGFGYDVNVGPLRGFDFGEFAGTRIALMNLEYRIPIVRNLVFEWPGRWSVGTVEGTLFIDAGTAWNKGHDLTLWSEKDFHLIDLKMSMGFGFLVNFILPINVEFAKSTDLNHFSPDYRIHFSFGRSF